MIRNEVVLWLANEVEISVQLYKLRLQWFGHIMRMPEVRTQHRLLCSRLSDKVRPKGGTPLRWIDLIAEDLRRITNWQQHVFDRPAWHRVIQTCPTVHPHEE